MKRSEFIKALGLGASGLVLPKQLLAKSPVKIYDNYIRGLPHYGYNNIKNQIVEGDTLILKRDVDNVYDSFAVEVYYANIKLGYLAAYENIVIANMLDAGVELLSKVSYHDTQQAKYKSLSIEIFADLISPTEQLITKLSDKRADELIDIYRQEYGI